MKKLMAVLAALVLAFSFGVFADNHEEEATLDIVATASANEDFSTLVDLVVAADLVDALSAEGPFTVFAPVNEAFAALDEETVAFLLSEEGREDLVSILTFHVVEGLALAADVEDGLGLVTLNGQKIMLAVDEDGVSVNGVSVIATDVLASNGVIHVIDGVLLPSTEEVTTTDYVDVDSDGDGIPDDTDNVPVAISEPDYLDADDDGDAILDQYEMERVDGGLVVVKLQDAIDYLYVNGLTMFGTEATFMGGQSLRRDEAAAFFARFARDVLGMEVDADAEGCAFSDLANAHQDLLGEIEAACQLGLMRGYEGRFMPTDTLSNAHAMTVLVRLLVGDQEEPEDNWAANYADVAKTAGLTVSLAADVEASLHAPISRADVAKMIEAASIYEAPAAVEAEEVAEEDYSVEEGKKL